MSFLTKEQQDALDEAAKTNAALAAVAKNLKEEQFIPKTRFDEINLKAKEAADALEKIQAERKAVEEAKLQEQGKSKELLELKERELAELKKGIESDKKDADAHRQYRKEKVDAYKTQLGEDWSPEYETLSLAQLEKLVAKIKGEKIAVDDSKPGSKAVPKSLAEMTPEEREQYIAKAKSGTLQK